jgi:hypothetical protein
VNRKFYKVLSTTAVLSMILAPGATWAQAADEQPAQQTTTTTDVATGTENNQQSTTTGDTISVTTTDDTVKVTPFKDLGKAALWAQPFITQAQEQKLINGDPDGKFRPLDNLSRREAAAIIFNILKLEPVTAEKSSFSDLSVQDWGSKYVEALKKADIMHGDGKGHFFPNNKITREELAVILVGAAGGDVKDKGNDLNLKDVKDVSEWAKPYVQAAMEMGLLKGDGKGQFFPKNNATRQEMAVMAVNLANALKDKEQGEQQEQVSTYKVTAEAPTEGFTAASGLVDTKDKTQEQINEAVTAATKDIKPLKVSLATDVKGTKGYEAVRFDKVNAGDNIQLWAKDSAGNWYDINQVGWGPEAGFALPADMPTAVTDVYVISDKEGEYPVNVKLIDVKTGNVIAQGNDKITVKAADSSSTTNNGTTTDNGSTTGNGTTTDNASTTNNGSTTDNGTATSSGSTDNTGSTTVSGS